ncbi:Uncharacterised protein [Mycobacteroides abscessus subsp. abscessus]|nr:Uncharacterised protein [Mycobacteroides abscessus subsp. abscessus]
MVGCRGKEYETGEVRYAGRPLEHRCIQRSSQGVGCQDVKASGHDDGWRVVHAVHQGLHTIGNGVLIGAPGCRANAGGGSGAREIEEVGCLIVGESQCAGDSVQHFIGDAC